MAILLRICLYEDRGNLPFCSVSSLTKLEEVAIYMNMAPECITWSAVSAPMSKKKHHAALCSIRVG